MTARPTISIRPTRSGAVMRYLLLGCFAVGPLVLVERIFGMNAPAAAQLLILPIGISLCVLAARRVRAILPRGERMELQLDQSELTVRRRGEGLLTIDRPDIGLVLLEDHPVQGVAAVRIYGPASQDIGRWETGWLGKRARRVKGQLETLGYPCAIRSELYDGRFQTQTPGQPPLLHRPDPGKERA